MKQVKRVAIGTGIALAVYLALSALLALLIVRGAVKENGVYVWIFACVAAFCGATAASYRQGERIVSAASCAAAFWGSVALLGYLTNDTLEPARITALALPVLAGTTAAYLLEGGGTGKRSRGKRKRHSRK